MQDVKTASEVLVPLGDFARTCGNPLTPGAAFGEEATIDPPPCPFQPEQPRGHRLVADQAREVVSAGQLDAVEYVTCLLYSSRAGVQWFRWAVVAAPAQRRCRRIA